MNRSTDLAPRADLARLVTEAQASKVVPIEQAQSPAAFVAAVAELAASTAARTVAAQQAQAHPGINVTIPAAPQATASLEEPAGRRMFTRAELFGWCGVWAGVSASGGIVGAAVSGSAYVTLGSIIGADLLTSMGAAMVSSRDDDRRQAQAGRGAR